MTTDRRLTDEQREMVARAWALAQPKLAMLRRRYGEHLDISGAVGERICRFAFMFDGRMSSLKRWAIHQASYAVRDEFRRFRLPGRSRFEEKPKVFSLDDPPRSYERDGTARDWHTVEPRSLMISDPPSPFELREDAERMLRGMRPYHREVVIGSVVEGRPLRAIGLEHGCSESAVSQARTAALDWLREREGPKGAE